MQITKTLRALTLSSAFLFASTSASAATYFFNIAGPQAISFTLDSSPIPNSQVLGDYFRIDGVSGLVNSLTSTFDLGFGSSAYSANFGFLNPTVGTFFITGPGIQLYTGTEAAPTFKTGTFALSDGYSISISPGVPEPATWAMMILGLGAVGHAMRRRSKITTRFSNAS